MRRLFVFTHLFVLCPLFLFTFCFFAFCRIVYLGPEQAGTGRSMATHLIPTAAGAGLALRLLDCSACALMNSLSGWKVTLEGRRDIANFSLDIITGGMMIGGAAETLVPFRLLETLHQTFDAPYSGGTSHKAAWDAVPRYDQFVVLIAPCDVPQLIQKFPLYKKVCLCVPSGPLCSRMLFEKYLEEFYAEEFNPALSALADMGGYKCTAWLRSSLTCRYEGLYVPGVRVAEAAARLLSCDILGEGGSCSCERVVFEEGIFGLTPRWLETVMKTAASCGVPMRCVMLALCRGESGNVGENYVLSKAMEVGIDTIAVTAVPTPLFPGTEGFLGIDDVRTFVSGWNDAGNAAASLEEVELVDDCVEYCALVRKQWQSLMPTI